MQGIAAVASSVDTPEVDGAAFGDGSGLVPGSRAERVAATRRRIRDAGRELFATQGYEHTTVAQIVEVAGVGLRTFYRYFPSKEHVAVEELRRFADDAVALIAARPSSESPIESLLAVVGVLAGRGYTKSMALDVLLVDTIPSVAGVQHHITMAAQDQITDVFAVRLGLSLHAIEPRAMAAVATLAYQAAARTWLRQIEAGKQPDDLFELGRAAILYMGHGFREM